MVSRPVARGGGGGVGRNEPIFGVELTLKFLEIENISRERFNSLVYGGVYRFCRTWSILFSNVRL